MKTMMKMTKRPRWRPTIVRLRWSFNESDEMKEYNFFFFYLGGYWRVWRCHQKVWPWYVRRRWHVKILQIITVHKPKSFIILDEEGDNGLGLGGLVAFANSKSDPYLGGIDDDDESDVEDFKIKPTDNLLLVGHVEGNASILEVYGKIILSILTKFFSK